MKNKVLTLRSRGGGSAKVSGTSGAIHSSAYSPQDQKSEPEDSSMKHKVLTLRARGGAKISATRAYPAEDVTSKSEATEPFRLLDLPSELRLKIYALIFHSCPDVIDLDPDNYKNIHRKLSILYASRQIHGEASHLLYSTRTFRIFPCIDRYFKSKRPLLARLSPRCRNSISSLELRLGPGFASPPKNWAVTESLGLKDATNVRILKVMVQVDTSDPMFNGYRARGLGESFYEDFSKSLLDKILEAVPSIREVQLDAWTSINKDGPMISGLTSVVNQHRKVISWGPERGWTNEKGKEVIDLRIAAKPIVIRIPPEVTVVS
ncbi:hypothetical protein V499_01317 [Pseudogymnoascus sp. VKM F-103]|uniref:F-box domain-containing protein n=1 Tax=Pseudogymnoascus verrucosus TaxID=342668 RepID=A0A1B8GQ79_9PEZI|nr:uncharacterized protein VE01_03986 [Pseudogymnoascus verrucosus]KFY79731.1 hypothetical protein V499_01317 [Pseudogymnoascus sp. VKM F-103]OBT97960.1 hypothetical protein VE01_03986 [Pseudogymnoascus verrucosus]